jgi:hypothetical protein
MRARLVHGLAPWTLSLEYEVLSFLLVYFKFEFEFIIK